MEYKELNRSYSVNGNKKADQLLFRIESMDLLSVNFKMKITNLVLMILTNHRGKEKAVTESIKDLKSLFDMVNIFNESFVRQTMNDLYEMQAFELRRFMEEV